MWRVLLWWCAGFGVRCGAVLFCSGVLPPFSALPESRCPSFTEPLRRPGVEGFPPPIGESGASRRTLRIKCAM